VRLELLPTEPAHAEALATALADRALNEHIGGEPSTAEQWRSRLGQWADRRSPDGGQAWLNWVVVERAGGAVVGWLQATVVGSSADVAYVVGTPWQGRAYATEAARALLDHLGATGVTEVSLLVAPANAPSAAVARHLGLSPDGTEVDGELRWSRCT
jgi:RimJ/RimL family protein N-acetyltransferase